MSWTGKCSEGSFSLGWWSGFPISKLLFLYKVIREGLLRKVTPEPKFLRNERANLAEEQIWQREQHVQRPQGSRVLGLLEDARRCWEKLWWLEQGTRTVRAEARDTERAGPP